MKKEFLTQVDSEGKVISSVEKLEAHKHPAKLHRAISVWLFDGLGNTILQ